MICVRIFKIYSKCPNYSTESVENILHCFNTILASWSIHCLFFFFSILLQWVLVVIPGLFIVVHGLSCLTACGILVPWPEIKPVSPALYGGFLTAEPPGKSLLPVFYCESVQAQAWNNVSNGLPRLEMRSKCRSGNHVGPGCSLCAIFSISLAPSPHLVSPHGFVASLAPGLQ